MRSELFPAPRTAGIPRIPGSGTGSSSGPGSGTSSGSSRFSHTSAYGVGATPWGSSSGNGKAPSGYPTGTAQRTGGYASGPSSWNLGQAAGGPSSGNVGTTSGPPSWSPMTPPLSPDGSRPNTSFDSIYQPYSLNGGEGNTTVPSSSSSSLHHRSSSSSSSSSVGLPLTSSNPHNDPAIRSTRRIPHPDNPPSIQPMSPIEPPKRGVTSYFQYGRQSSFRM